MSGEDRWYVIFDTLRNQYGTACWSPSTTSRAGPSGTSSTRPSDGTAGTGALRIAFLHIHLPKLHETGYITWRKDDNEVHRGPRFEEIRPVIDSFEQNRHRLPGGWL